MNRFEGGFELTLTGSLELVSATTPPARITRSYRDIVLLCAAVWSMPFQSRKTSGVRLPRLSACCQ